MPPAAAAREPDSAAVAFARSNRVFLSGAVAGAEKTGTVFVVARKQPCLCWRSYLAVWLQDCWKAARSSRLVRCPASQLYQLSALSSRLSLLLAFSLPLCFSLSLCLAVCFAVCLAISLWLCRCSCLCICLCIWRCPLPAALCPLPAALCRCSAPLLLSLTSRLSGSLIVLSFTGAGSSATLRDRPSSPTATADTPGHRCPPINTPAHKHALSHCWLSTLSTRMVGVGVGLAGAPTCGGLFEGHAPALPARRANGQRRSDASRHLLHFPIHF